MNQNDCYQVPVIIGAGISSASIVMLNPNVVVFDKGKFPGGRLSSKYGINSSPFDFGATMFSDLMDVRWLGQETKYSISEIWKSKSVHIPTRPIYDDTHFYPENGMGNIVSSMLGENKTIQSHKLIKIEMVDETTWKLEFLVSVNKQIKTITAKNIILTIPIPQILEILHFSEKNQKLKHWSDFLGNYNDYRKTLVSYFYWDNWKPNWKELLLNPEASIPVTTLLNRGEDWEYLSWESLKYNNKFVSGSALLVQFGSLFSENHFEDWMDENKNPKPKYKELLIQELKKRFGAPEPNIIWQHRWKYAQAQIPLLGKEGALNLDIEEFEVWKKLGKETGITILGDWLFGARIERIVGGISFLTHNNLLH